MFKLRNTFRLLLALIVIFANSLIFSDNKLHAAISTKVNIENFLSVYNQRPFSQVYGLKGDVYLYNFANNKERNLINEVNVYDVVEWFGKGKYLIYLEKVEDKVRFKVFDRETRSKVKLPVFYGLSGARWIRNNEIVINDFDKKKLKIVDISLGKSIVKNSVQFGMPIDFAYAKFTSDGNHFVSFGPDFNDEFERTFLVNINTGKLEYFEDLVEPDLQPEDFIGWVDSSKILYVNKTSIYTYDINSKNTNHVIDLPMDLEVGEIGPLANFEFIDEDKTKIAYIQSILSENPGRHLKSNLWELDLVTKASEKVVDLKVEGYEDYYVQFYEYSPNKKFIKLFLNTPSFDYIDLFYTRETKEFKTIPCRKDEKRYCKYDWLK